MKAIDLHIANHLRLADEDLKAAKVLIKAGNRFGAYHAEQAAEKILLALITSEQTHVERKDAHRLDVLRDKGSFSEPRLFDRLRYYLPLSQRGRSSPSTTI